jgi:hypothetical protein
VVEVASVLRNCPYAKSTVLEADLLPSPVKSVTSWLKGVTFVKLGNFENVPAPVFEAYVKDRQGFEKAWEGVDQFEVNPPAAG